jgi:hypothetical protein
MLYGPSNEPTPRRTARESNGDSDNPQSGATSTKPLDPRTLTAAQALDATTGDGLASRGGSTREPTVLKKARTRAPLPEARGGCEQDADMARMTPATAAARCFCSFFVAAPDSEMPERALLSRPTDIVKGGETPR